MIIVDANLLIYAHNSSGRAHEQAKLWWEGMLNGYDEVGLAWTTMLAFLRVMTHARIIPNPMHLQDAIEIVRAWLARKNVKIVTPGAGHAAILLRLLEDVGVGGNLTSDAHLAALALEYRAQVATTDVDFARFGRVRWFNPCATR